MIMDEHAIRTILNVLEKGGVTIHCSNDRNYAALKHTSRDRKG